jgi:hypothetical protein
MDRRVRGQQRVYRWKERDRPQRHCTMLVVAVVLFLLAGPGFLTRMQSRRSLQQVPLGHWMSFLRLHRSALGQQSLPEMSRHYPRQRQEDLTYYQRQQHEHHAPLALRQRHCRRMGLPPK